MKATAALSFLLLFLTTSNKAWATESDVLLDALDEAYLDEVRAETWYQEVIEQFGKIRPFSRIVQAERNHIRALERVYARYGFELPALQVPTHGAFGSVQEACRIGVRAEIENIEMYDRLEQPIDEADVLLVFGRLRWASQERHLPAFRRCSR